MRRSLLVLALASCTPRAPVAAPDVAPAPRCDASDEEDDRLVVDWSPLDRAKLESAVRHGVVPIRVDGCRPRVVDTCIIHRMYAFTATSRQRETLVLRDRDELGARLPVLATRLGASFARTSALDVAMTVVGRYEAGAAGFGRGDLDGECERVTHVVASVSVGAFVIATANATSIDGSIDVVHASRARERSRIDSAGVEERCSLARRADVAPPEDCAIPLRVELRRVSDVAHRPSPAPPPIPDSDAMRRAMEATRKQLAMCHRVARASSPDLSGVLTLGVKLARNGHVKSVSARHEGNIDDDMSECAAERVAMVWFPPADDDRPRSLVIPILFRGLER